MVVANCNNGRLRYYTVLSVKGVTFFQKDVKTLSNHVPKYVKISGQIKDDSLSWIKLVVWMIRWNNNKSSLFSER